ncbi:hypothetical protein [Sulfitobacter dubius]|uniref:hypothetical protein n=1 Tax=Sulfitobacter dubius TaxID=218673 RepID=UPI0022AF22A9|nr:hypothetical protein [Sulfitobacter dubius]MCZ4367689.1 hypothetical protein [Sulfitobacter dubius]
MKSFFKLLIGLLTVTALGTILWFLYKLTAYVLVGAKELKPNEYVPLFVAFVTAAVGLTGALYTQNRIRKREIDDAHRAKKTEIYFSFIKLIERVMMAHKDELGLEPLDEGELVKKLIEFKTDCLLWGSEEVLQALVDFQTLSTSQPTPKQILRSIDPLYRAMRNDIGLTNTRLAKDFFAKWPLSDPKEFDRIGEGI